MQNIQNIQTFEERLKDFTERVNNLSTSYETTQHYPELEITEKGRIITLVSIHNLYGLKEDGDYYVPKGYVVHIAQDNNFYRVPKCKTASWFGSFQSFKLLDGTNPLLPCKVFMSSGEEGTYAIF